MTPLEILEKVLVILVPLLTAIPGIAALLLLRSQRRKTEAETDQTKADAADKLAEAAGRLLQPYKDQVDALSLQLKTNSQRVEESTNAFEECRDRLKDLVVEISKLKDTNLDLISKNLAVQKEKANLEVELAEIKTRHELQLEELKTKYELQIHDLESKIDALVKQLASLGETPNFGRRETDIMKEV